MKLTELTTEVAIALMEGGLIPDTVTRRAIRTLCRQRLKTLDQGSSEANERVLAEFVAATRRSPVAPVPHKANEQHYEVPAEFFQLVLGRRRKYSSCYFPDDSSTLDEAEDESLRQTCEHAGLKDGMRVLELGCGWGALSLWILEHYPRCHVTAVSNSASQREFIEAEARRLGFAGRLRVLTADMNDFAITERFDRVISVEMFEHMRNYEQLLRRIAGWLTPEGRLLVHIFCHRRFAYEFLADGAANWMGRYFFSGGIMPSDNLLLHYGDDLRVLRHWRWNGNHYRRTAEAWVTHLDQRQERIMPILSRIYGAADARRWWRRWRLLFLAGAELFGYDGGEEWYVSHYLFGPACVTAYRDFAEERAGPNVVPTGSGA